MAELAVPPPKPAREYLPQWYQGLKAFDTKKPEFDKDGGVNVGLKMCMPFYDSMVSGYIQESWQDIYIDYKDLGNNNFELKYYYPTQPEIMSYREKVNVPLGNDFHNAEFVFHPAWSPELPKGWSMLYITPFNRMDLPFSFLSGIIDADNFSQSETKSNIPFYIKKSFSGMIPKGTPLVQMIPIQRKSWNSSFEKFDEDKQTKISQQIRQYFWGGYKKIFWQKKEYR
jgi:hypothetical protein